MTANPLDALSRKSANPEAERAVIAALMRDPDPHKIIKHGICADMFTFSSTREAFQGITALLADDVQPDAATLRNAVSDATLIEIETSLTEHASAANLPVYVQLLKDCHREREIQAARAWLMQAVSAGRPAHELRAIVEGIETAAGASNASPFVDVEELCRLPPSNNWLIKNYIVSDGLNVLFGDPGCGKSFAAIDMACHIATGRPWRGQTVTQGRVLYIAGEGRNGLSKRFKAWFQHHGEPERNIKVSTNPIQLVDAGSIAALLANIRALPEQPSLIVVDTINRNFGPGDENSTADMTKAVAGLDAIRTATGAAILVLHHTGHGDKTRARGSIVLNASLDMEYRLEKSGTTIQMLNTKSKDYDTPPPLAWTIQKEVLPWADEEREPINSAVLASTDVSTKASTRQMLTRPQRLTLESLDKAIERYGDNEAALVADWRRVALDAGITQSESRQGKHAAFMRAVDALVDAGLVVQDGCRYSKPKASTRQQTSTNSQHVDNVDAGTAVAKRQQTSTHPLRGVDGVDVDAVPHTRTKPDKTGHCPGVRVSGLPGQAADPVSAMAQWRNGEESPPGDSKESNPTPGVEPVHSEGRHLISQHLVADIADEGEP